MDARQFHLTSLFQSLHTVLNDKSKNYQDKVTALVTIWQQLSNFMSEASRESFQSNFENLFLSTLRIVFRADWPKISPASKTHLSHTLQLLINNLKKGGSYHNILQNCKILESIVKDPWGHPVLQKIIKTDIDDKENAVDLKECEEYFKFENPKVVVTRLETLLLSNCEDIATRLCKACLDTYNHLDGMLDFNQEEIDYITDIYFSSLLKNKKKSHVIAEIQKYPLDEGLRLLQRYRTDMVGGNSNEYCRAARVWKCKDKLIELLSNTLLANAVLHGELVESQSQLEALVAEWAAILTTDGELAPDALKAIRKFVLIAQSSMCIYPFCSFLIRNGNCKEQDFTMVAQCLIRAINQNMNEVEQHRANHERDKLKETYDQLSKGFVLLAELLSECENIYKECLLTSFSLTPTRERLQSIEARVTKPTTTSDPLIELQPKENQTDEPKQTTDSSGIEIKNSMSNVEVTVPSETASEQPESCSTAPSEITPASIIPPETTSNNSNEISQSADVPDKNDNQICEELDSKQISKPIDCEKDSSLAYVTELENLRLFDESTAGDLNTILSYRRYHALTWDLEWSKLKENCEQYLEDFENKDFEDIELKYLDLDYNQFKDKPINSEDLYGIEKGYEHYAYTPSESDEELSSTKRSGLSSFESDEDILLCYRKRKKAISSDSDEPRNKKRARKSNKRRDSQKSDTGSATENDKIRNTIESVIAGKSNPSELQKLRSFRITSLKYNNNNPDDPEMITKEQEELNNILADSYRIVESMNLPALSPRFNVYDIILDETLVPSDSEIRLPKCSDLTYKNEDKFTPICSVAESNEVEEKPRKSVAKAKNSAPRKKQPKVPKLKISTIPKLKISAVLKPNDSYLNISSGPTLLSNDELFKKKYGSKPKPDEKMIENHDTNNTTNIAAPEQNELKVQLPKLCESFTAKKTQAVKAIDPSYSEFTFTSYFKNKVDSDNIDDIKHFMNTYESPNDTPAHVTNSSQQPTTVESTCQTDFEMPFVGLNEDNLTDLEQILNTPSSTYSMPDFDSPKLSPIHNNVPRGIPNISQLVSVPSPSVSQPSNVVSSYICTARKDNGIVLKRTNTEKINTEGTENVVKILQQYRTAIAENPGLNDVPAPRKRNNSTSTSKKPRSRAKKDSQPVKIVKTPKLNGYADLVDSKLAAMNVPYATSKPNGYAGHVETEPGAMNVPYTTSIPNGYADHVKTEPAAMNVPYANGILCDESSSKLPQIVASSQVMSFHQSVPLSDVPTPVPNIMKMNSMKVTVCNKRSTLQALLMQGSSPSKCSSATVEEPSFQVVNRNSYAPQLDPSVTGINNIGRNNHPTARINNPGQPNNHSTTQNNLEQQISLTTEIDNFGLRISPAATPVTSLGQQTNNFGQQISPAVSQVNNVRQHMNPITTQINNFGQQIIPTVTQVNSLGNQFRIPTIRLPNLPMNNYYQQINASTNQINNPVSQVQHNETEMNAVSANTSYNTFNSSSQPQKANHHLKGYEGLTNDFEVRIPRIDCAGNYSTNNAQYSYLNKTINDTRNTNNHLNIPPAGNNLNPSVVIPMLPITAIPTMRNNTISNANGNYHTKNANIRTTPSSPTTSIQNAHVNMNSSIQATNFNHYLPTVALPTIQNLRDDNDITSQIIYGSIDANNVISIPPDSLSNSYSVDFETYLNSI